MIEPCERGYILRTQRVKNLKRRYFLLCFILWDEWDGDETHLEAGCAENVGKV